MLPFIFQWIALCNAIGCVLNPHWDPDYRCDPMDPAFWGLDWHSLSYAEAALMGWHGENRYVRLYRHWYC